MFPASTSKTQGNLVDYTSNKIGSNLPPATSNSQESSVVNGGSNFIPTNETSTQGLQLPNDTKVSNESGGKRLELPSNSNSSSVNSTTNTPINDIIRPAQNYVNNLQENFAFPTNEQLQAMDNKKISESTDTLNLKEIKRPQKEKTYKTNLERSSGLIEQKIKAIEEGKIKRSM